MSTKAPRTYWRASPALHTQLSWKAFIFQCIRMSHLLAFEHNSPGSTSPSSASAPQPGTSCLTSDSPPQLHYISKIKANPVKHLQFSFSPKLYIFSFLLQFSSFSPISDKVLQTFLFSFKENLLP